MQNDTPLLLIHISDGGKMPRVDIETYNKATAVYERLLAKGSIMAPMLKPLIDATEVITEGEESGREKETE